MAGDQSLLKRYASSRDADAFAELLRRYAPLVYGVCLRTTGSPHDAEDVAQECFLELARNAGSITSSLPGWLYSLARSRSVDALRRARSRERREERAMKGKASRDDLTWAEIAPHVDRALEELPEELRAPLILHYVLGRTQAEVAEELRLNQSNVSRRLRSGIRALRDRLGKLGVAVPVAFLAALLAENAAQAAPPALMAALGKMTIAGIGKATGASAKAGLLGVGTLKTKVAAVAVVTALAVTGGFVALSRRRPDAPAVTSSRGTAVAPGTPVAPAERRISVSWHGVGLPQALDDLHALAGLRSACERHADKGRAVTLDAEDAPVSEVVARLAGVTGLAYHREGDLAFFWDPRNEEINRRLRHTPVTFFFNDTPLLEALRFLSVATQIEIGVDMEGSSRNYGVPIMLQAVNMRAGVALLWVTRLAGMRYIVRGGAVVVSTPDRIDVASPPPERGREDRLRRAASPQVLAALDDALALEREDFRRITSETLEPMVASGKYVRLPRPPRWGAPDDSNDMLALNYLSRATERRSRFIQSEAWLAIGPEATRDGDKRAVAQLRQALVDDDEEARREAETSLLETRSKGERHHFGVLRDMFPRVCAEQRRMAAGVLPIIDLEVALPYVKRLLAGDYAEPHASTPKHWWERVPAASMLATSRRDDAVALAREAVDDENRFVRGLAVYALCVHGDDRALPLAEKALSDPEVETRKMIPPGLAVIGGEKVLPLLERALGDAQDTLAFQSERVRCAAAIALGRVGGEGALPLLEKAQTDEIWRVRKSAAEALVDIGTEGALALFENSLRDTEPEVVRHALERLAQARSPAGLAAMVKAMETHGSDVLGKTWDLKLLKEPPREPERSRDVF